MKFTYHNYRTREWQGKRLSHHQANLLFILHVRHGIVSHDDIVEFIWPDANTMPVTADKVLRSIIMVVRRKFSAGVIATHSHRGYEIVT